MSVPISVYGNRGNVLEQPAIIPEGWDVDN